MSNLIYSIYKITNQLNDKVYIGQTSKTIENRFKTHIKEMQNGSDTKWHRALKKYTPDVFFIESIYQTKNSKIIPNN